MTGVFERLEHEWDHLTGGHRSQPATLSPDSAIIEGDTNPMTLTGLADQLKTTLEGGAVQLHAALDEHLPQLAALAAGIEADPLIAAARNAANLPADVRQGLADMITRVDGTYPAQTGTAPVDPASPATPGAAPAAA